MPDPKDLIDDLATWAGQRITAHASAAKDLLDHLVDNDYTGNEFAADMTAAWKRVSEDISTLLAILPQPPTPTPTPPPPTPTPPGP